MKTKRKKRKKLWPPINFKSTPGGFELFFGQCLQTENERFSGELLSLLSLAETWSMFWPFGMIDKESNSVRLIENQLSIPFTYLCPIRSKRNDYSEVWSGAFWLTKMAKKCVYAMRDALTQKNTISIVEELSLTHTHTHRKRDGAREVKMKRHRMFIVYMPIHSRMMAFYFVSNLSNMFRLSWKFSQFSSIVNVHFHCNSRTLSLSPSACIQNCVCSAVAIWKCLVKQHTLVW